MFHKIMTGIKDSFKLIWVGGYFSWVLALVFATLATILTTMSLQRIPFNLEVAAIATRNIKADHNYEIVDDEATQKFKEDSTSSILLVYDFDKRVGDSIAKRIHEAFSLARASLDAKGGSSRGKKYLESVNTDELEKMFSEKLGVTLTPDQWGILLDEHFNVRVEASIISLLRQALSGPVVGERGSLDAEKDRGVHLRKFESITDELQDKPPEEQVFDDVGKIMSTEEIRHQIENTYSKNLRFDNQSTSAVVVALAELLVEPNCTLNLTETEKRKSDALANVKNVIIKVNAGEMIIREGSRFEPWHIKVLEGIKKEKRKGIYSVEFAGTFLLILLFVMVPITLVRKYFIRVSLLRNDYFLMTAVGLATLALMRLSLILAPAVQSALFINVPLLAFNYLIPVAGGAMLLRIFLGAEISFVFAVVMSAIAGLFVESDSHYVAFCLVSSAAAVVVISQADRRGLIIRAGIITGFISSLTALAIGLIGIFSEMQNVGGVTEVLWSMLFAFLGGIFSAIFVMIATPIVESVSGYISDIKLLELANLNHPLLRELIVRAPGTYHHSHMVGILGEAAAEAIGAKALFVRVGAYYHDIGKMKKPSYFIENAKAGDDKHERLSPHMSALIVAAHVKDGVDMAEKASIPKIIADIIPEHHGTRLISFFYDKVKNQADAKVEKVDPKDFMYPGPKPQTREAAILMLADAAEASVRSLKEKSPTRIQQTVQKVITDIFMEKQLDECELTLKDLNDISRAFVRILLGIYHSRIEYPKDSEENKPEVSIVDEGDAINDNDRKSSSS